MSFLKCKFSDSLVLVSHQEEYIIGAQGAPDVGDYTNVRIACFL